MRHVGLLCTVNFNICHVNLLSSSFSLTSPEVETAHHPSYKPQNHHQLRTTYRQTRARSGRLRAITGASVTDKSQVLSGFSQVIRGMVRVVEALVHHEI